MSGWAQVPSCSPGLDRATPTPLSHSSMASPSPAVLLKLLVLEEEREMLARPFSFNFIKGLQGTGRPTLVTRGQRAGQASHAEIELAHQQLPTPLLVGFGAPESSQSKRSLGQRHISGLQVAKASPSPTLTLTFPCWDRFLESWDWMRSQTLSPEKSVRHPGSWDCWMHCH